MENKALTNLEFGRMPNNRALSNLEFGNLGNSRSVSNLEFNMGNQISMDRKPQIVSRQIVRLKDGSIGMFVVLNNGKQFILPLRK